MAISILDIPHDPKYVLVQIDDGVTLTKVRVKKDQLDTEKTYSDLLYIINFTY